MLCVVVELLKDLMRCFWGAILLDTLRAQVPHPCFGMRDDDPLSEVLKKGYTKEINHLKLTIHNECQMSFVITNNYS